MLSPVRQPQTLAAAPLNAFAQNGSQQMRKQLTLHYHLVLRVNADSLVINDENRKEFYKCLIGCVQAAGGKAEAIGGANNLVHLLVALNTNHYLADFVRGVKLVSSVLAKRQMQAGGFAWQEEYEAFTVSLSQREPVRRYIMRQQDYHTQFGAEETFNSSWQRNAVESAELY